MLPRFYKSFLPIFLFFGATTLNAQHVHDCGQFDAEQALFNNNPQIKVEAEKANKELETFTANFKPQNRRGSTATQYIIPIVFHVVHQNGPENISDAQVFDAVRILNQDFNDPNNPRHTAIVSAFQSVIGNPNIEFRLARKDPNGNPTNGIDRITSSETFVGDEGSKLNGWPRDKYLNIWICDAVNGSSGAGGVLAYAFKPGAAHGYPAGDGIIVKHPYVGTVGTSIDSEGATLTHEIGHYFNLDHTWGGTNNPGLSTNCNSDDGVSDTPPTIGQQGGCNTSFQSCGSLDNAQNFMEYTRCELMFTQGQVNRMIASLNSTIAQRNNLWDPANLTATGVDELFEANFVLNRVNVCARQSVDFSDVSAYGASGWDWTFTGGNPSTSTNENPSVMYELPGLYDVSLNATQGSKQESVTKSNYVFVSSAVGKSIPASENFSSINAIPTGEWFAYNIDNDAYGFELSTNNGYSGSKGIVMKNFGNDVTTNDELYTTTYDFSVLTDVTVSFKYAYKRKAPIDGDRMTLYISNDCGLTWTSIWSKLSGALATTSGLNGSAFVPGSNSDWRTETISTITSANLTEGVQFKFLFESKDGNNLYFDDFNITGTFKTEAQLEYPFNNSINRASTTALKWKPMANASSYEYELDTDASFSSSNLQTGTISGTDYIPSSPLTNGETYYWRVRLIVGGVAQSWSSTWKFTVASDGVGFEDLLKSKMNFKVYPNPTNENTVVQFDTDKDEEVSMYIVDVTGRVKTWFENNTLNQGSHVFYLNELNLTSGVYSVIVKIGDNTVTERLIVK